MDLPLQFEDFDFPFPFDLQATSEPSPPSELPDDFWTKLKSLQEKYRTQLHDLFPKIRAEHDRNPTQMNQQLMQQLRDYFAILHMPMQDTIPEYMSVMVLQEMEMNLEQIVGRFGGGHGCHTVRSETEGLRVSNQEAEQIWAKLYLLQNHYRSELYRVFPRIKQDKEPPFDRRLFLVRLRDCFAILHMQRQEIVPPEITIARLERTEQFIQGIISKYGQIDNAG